MGGGARGAGGAWGGLRRRTNRRGSERTGDKRKARRKPEGHDKSQARGGRGSRLGGEAESARALGKRGAAGESSGRKEERGRARGAASIRQQENAIKCQRPAGREGRSSSAGGGQRCRGGGGRNKTRGCGQNTEESGPTTRPDKKVGKGKHM